MADEVRPGTPARRLAHAAVRIPLHIITFLLTQTTTKPVQGLSALVLEAGFRIESEKRSSLGSLFYMVAINVWCASAGGLFTDQRVIAAVKVSGLADKVRHRRLILPALSAPGVDLGAIRAATGFKARFGPVYARDIPAYLENGERKTDAMRRSDFGPGHRLDMFLPMNFPVYLPVVVVLAAFWPQCFLGYTILFWSAVAFSTSS